jgi:hypothetical protein
VGGRAKGDQLALLWSIPATVSDPSFFAPVLSLRETKGRYQSSLGAYKATESHIQRKSRKRQYNHPPSTKYWEVPWNKGKVIGQDIAAVDLPLLSDGFALEPPFDFWGIAVFGLNFFILF